jgi:ABC-2 type transport system ATP-binding protein
MVRATLAGANAPSLTSLPGADSIEVRGETVLVHASDSDAVARYLLDQTPAHDLEITVRNLEDAFLALTSGTEEPEDPSGRDGETSTATASATNIRERSLR